MTAPAPCELNILFITADQLRADVLHGRLAGIAPTPNLDRLARESVVFENHVTVTAPCGPARASLLSGLYAFNHGSLRNGTPLDAGLTNLAKEWRKAGREPLLFGYTDATPDPDVFDPADPALRSYEGLLPGFREVVEMRFESPHTWLAHLIAKGYDLPRPLPQRLFELYLPQGGEIAGPALYRAEDSDTALLTDLTIAHLDARRDHPWTAHLTYIRPHPPFVAPAPWNAAVDPSAFPLPGEDHADHPFTRAWFSERNSFGLWMGFDGDCEGLAPAKAQALRAVYLGLVAELDHHIGRLLDWLEATGQAERTVVVFTGDHGEMLGDGRMWGKHSVFEKAFHVPLMIRDPRRPAQAGRRVSAPTESVDLAPTLLSLAGREPPAPWDGRPLTPWLEGETPDWRTSALMEIDFAEPPNASGPRETRFQRAWGTGLEDSGAVILREGRWRLIRFAAEHLPPMLFDMEADPEETANLAPQMPDRVARMTETLLRRRLARSGRGKAHLAVGV